MHSNLQEVFDILETQRKKALESVQHLSEVQLNTPPAEGKWSIAQILSHIITAERLSALYVRKKMQGAADARDSGLWEEIKFFVLKVSQRFPGLKFTAPKLVVDHTVLYPDLMTITREWESVRKDLHSILEKIPDRFVRRRIFRHARAGYLNVRQGLLFLREHIVHHSPQIRKLANQS